MRLGHTREKSLQALAKQILLNGVKTCKLEFYEHCVIGKKTKVKFGTAVYHAEGILDYVHRDVWGLPRWHHLKVCIILYHSLMISLAIVGCTP